MRNVKMRGIEDEDWVFVGGQKRQDTRTLLHKIIEDTE